MIGGPPADIIALAGSPIRCHRCSYFCGEAAEALKLFGIVKSRWLVDLIPRPRYMWLCPKCGWYNLYERLTAEPVSV